MNCVIIQGQGKCLPLIPQVSEFGIALELVKDIRDLGLCVKAQYG